MSQTLRAAPPIDAVTWFNTPAPLSLEALRGRVVVIESFQMLCPGCVSNGLPQATRIFETFRREDVAVIGLHTVFEHHAAQTPVSLEAFLHEYRIPFPVGVDAPGEAGGPSVTMTRYGMRGTPTLTLIDRQGRLRAQHFGHVSDLRLGAEIMALIGETAPAGQGDAAEDGPAEPEGVCTAEGRAIA
ncbi:MAG: redoxin domain-containing protein [Micropepsaceae bacterium]